MAITKWSIDEANSHAAPDADTILLIEKPARRVPAGAI
jgi:hypothetical protein